MKRLLPAVAMIGLALGSLTILMAGPLPAQAAPVNTYIKGSGPTVYWHAANGRRYVFPNAATFNSWVGSTGAAVTTIGDTELYTIPIGGNMTYRPGARLVKVVTDPRVYAVARYGVLRWITSEAVARTLYGENWNRMVDDLPDEFFVNYTVGTPINSASDYSVSAEFNAVNHPGDNISAQASIGGTTPPPTPPMGSVSIAVDRATIQTSDTNRTATFTATVSATTLPTERVRIQIYRDSDGGVERTCNGTLACSWSYTAPANAPYSVTGYRAELRDRNNHALVNTSANLATLTVLGPVVAAPVPNNRFLPATAVVTEVIDHSLEGAYDVVRIRVRLLNPPASLTGVQVSLFRSNGELFVNYSDQSIPCSAQAECVFRSMSNQVVTNTIYARAFDAHGNVRQSAPITFTSNPSFFGTNRFLSATRLEGAITARWMHSDGETVEYHATLVNPPSVLTGVVIRVYDADTNTQIRIDCPATTDCDFTMTNFTRGTRRLYARATDAYGNTLTTPVLSETFGPVSSFSVTDVSTVLDPGKPNRCVDGFGALGTITVNGAGTVTYQWERSDGAIAPIETITFQQAGSRTVSREWFLSGTYSGWMRLKITSPNALTSNQTAIVSQCVANSQPPQNTFAFSCGPHMQTYRVTSSNQPDGLGVRCVKRSEMSAARAGIPALAWYGEGRWGTAHYRHVGQALPFPGQVGMASYQGFASDITGNGESTAGNFDGNITLTVVNQDTIRVTGAWNEEWRLVANGELDVEPFAPPQTCGWLFDEYRVQSLDRYQAEPAMQSLYRTGNGLRCMLRVGPQATTWYGVGDWNGQRYAHLATHANTGLGATDFCQNSGDFCSNFAYGSLWYHRLDALGIYTVDGWNEAWLR